jgi:hypothetical protein
MMGFAKAQPILRDVIQQCVAIPNYCAVKAAERELAAISIALLRFAARAEKSADLPVRAARRIRNYALPVVPICRSHHD